MYENIKNIMNKRYSQLPFYLYTLITFFIWYKTKFNVFELIPDFNFYFSYAYNFWGDLNSDLAKNILEAYGGIDYRGDWQPSPLYPILILSPLNIFGSKILFALEGYLVGIGFIYLIKKIIYQFDLNLDERFKFFSLIACALSPVMLTNTIALTNIGVWGFLLIIGIYYSNNFIIRTLSLIFAALVRPNFGILLAIFLINYYKGIIPKKNGIKITLLIVSLSYIIFYLIYHNKYPGNFINYFLFPGGQGLSTFETYGREFLYRTLNLKEKLLNADLNLFSITKIMSSLEGINYIFQLYFARINSLLGYNFEGLYQLRLNNAQWISKILRTSYYFFLIMPGFLVSMKLTLETIFNKSRSNQKKLRFLILTSFLYVVFSSMLIAVPRYLFPFDSVLICLGMVFWISNTNNTIKGESSF